MFEVWIKKKTFRLIATLSHDHKEGPAIYYVNVYQLMKELDIMYIPLQTSITIGNLSMTYLQGEQHVSIGKGVIREVI